MTGELGTHSASAVGGDRIGRLWRNSDFARFWSAFSVSQLGTQITRVALPMTAILTLHAGAGQVGALTAVEYLPFLLIGLPAGSWVDRHRRRSVLIVADAARAILLALIPLSYLLGVLRLYWLYPIAFLTGLCTTYFDVAHQSYLPALVPASSLADGNSKLELSVSAAEVSGPGLAGLLVQVLRAPIVILADAVSYLVSMVFLAAIRAPEDAPVPPEDGYPTMREDMVLGLRLVLGNSRLRLITICTGLQNFGFGGMIIALLLLFGIRTLHLSPAILGLVLAAGSVGAVTAAATASRIFGRFGLGRSLAAAVAAAGVTTLLIPLATPADAAPMLVIALGGASFGGVLYNVGQVTLRQSITAPHQLGRMNATVRFLVWGMIPIGAGLGGFLGETIGLRPAIWAGAIVALTAVIPVLCRPLLCLVSIPGLEEEAASNPV